jgi:hypothetical protein
MMEEHYVWKLRLWLTVFNLLTKTGIYEYDYQGTSWL